MSISLKKRNSFQVVFITFFSTEAAEVVSMVTRNTDFFSSILWGEKKRNRNFHHYVNVSIFENVFRNWKDKHYTHLETYFEITVSIQQLGLQAPRGKLPKSGWKILFRLAAGNCLRSIAENMFSCFLKHVSGNMFPRVCWVLWHYSPFFCCMPLFLVIVNICMPETCLNTLGRPLKLSEQFFCYHFL